MPSSLLRLLPIAVLGALLSRPGPACASSVDQPFLWEVEGPGAPSHLLGTIHAGVDADELPDKVWERLADSELFVLESHPDSPWPTNATTPEPMDLTLARRAGDIGLPVRALESLTFQRAVLQRIGSAGELAAMLGESTPEVDELAQAYRDGSLRDIAALTGDMPPQMRALLLDDRNHRWVRQLEPALARGNAFVAVGVGHMAGPVGLPALLHTRGYNVRRLS
jgi:uncharacterized protein YbaP (TraB family)